MDPKKLQASRPTPWNLAARQHGVVTRTQLLEIGLRSDAIRHRLAKGRLHRVHQGVYAVGRPELSRHGRWMAAVFSCGPGTALSHASAASAIGIQIPEHDGIEVSVRYERAPRRLGVVVHRRTCLGDEDFTVCDGIPVTSVVCTLVDGAETQRTSARGRGERGRDPRPDRPALPASGPRPPRGAAGSRASA